MKIYSWNVNGVRAVLKKGFLTWLQSAKPDILCLQETRALPEQLPGEIFRIPDYETIWHPAKKRGYSGVATFFRKNLTPNKVSDMGHDGFDVEGRAQVLEYPEFNIINAYFPNSQPQRRRLDYKLEFFRKIAELAESLVEKGKNVILCGDFNVAHRPIDLARPEENRDNPGFYPEECDAMDCFLENGFIDTFRHFHPGEPGHYSWWSYRTRARERNVGWRLDYHCVNRDFLPRVKTASILSDIYGSDHCPVMIEIQ